MVSSTPRPHFTPGKVPVPIVQEAWWAPGPVCAGGKSRPNRDSIPDRPARSSVAIPTELPDPHIQVISKAYFPITSPITFYSSCLLVVQFVTNLKTNLYSNQVEHNIEITVLHSQTQDTTALQPLFFNWNKLV